jgi:hypothetical protein
MNDIQRKAEFYARLASVKKLEALTLAEKEQIMVDAVKADLLPSVFVKAAWSTIAEVYPLARKIIGDLIDKFKADVRELDEKIRKDSSRATELTLDKKTHRVIRPRPIRGYIFTCLNEVIDADHFPFARCLMCENIFVPGKNQKYCSKPCATKALAPWKARYMKNYMSDRRRKERA